MSEPRARFWELFFAVYEALPRQGPGNRASAEKALQLCTELAQVPDILDLGCGVGAQTIHLAELTAGSILALDKHAPSIERLNTTLSKRGLTPRVRAIVGDMAHLEGSPNRYDLIWSEGALYNLGMAQALPLCHSLLRLGGYLVFSDAVWRKEDVPSAIKANFTTEYPTMGWVDSVVAATEEHHFTLIGHFTLPDEAWWHDFYTPMEARIEELRRQYSDDSDATAILDELAQEPIMHRRYCEYYAYEFFVARK